MKWLEITRYERKYFVAKVMNLNKSHIFNYTMLIFTTRNNFLFMILENMQLISTLMALSVSVSAHCMPTAVTQSKSRGVLSYMIYSVSLQNVKSVGNGKLNSLCHQQDQVLKARVK